MSPISIAEVHVREQVAQELVERLRRYGGRPALPGLTPAESARAAIENLLEAHHGDWQPTDEERAALLAVLDEWGASSLPDCLSALRYWLENDPGQ